ncbi:copper chaperone PCu(A)C [Haematobacter genomosp. 1]|uniref:Copper chaperone PCu(A)C n=1 Tax=Haematobacter genomosp. 1 TaxID=366618 RepID=A0A212AH13_9RHOB|nr:copper chaperone PCu(A)C [Haematobacter genomosp. 1]OWJ80703.1 hypothetical protein CDV49_00495 [Haematobacter genomosp. 1]
MFRTLLAATLFATPLLAVPALAHEFKAGELTIGHPYSFEVPSSARAAAGYLSITNTGSAPDRLVGVEAKVGNPMIHLSEEKDGVARMTHVEAVEIAPGQTVTLAPGGYHVMFTGLNGTPWTAGEKIPATLVFEKTGKVPVVFNVEARKDGGADPHAHH